MTEYVNKPVHQFHYERQSVRTARWKWSMYNDKMAALHSEAFRRFTTSPAGAD